MIRKSVFSAFVVAVCIVISCGGGGSGGDSGDNDNSVAITAFGFTSAKNSVLSANVTGVISGTNISVTVPYNTTVTGLVATFTTTGTSMTIGSTEQTSGTTANDFSLPKTYRVTDADGSTKDYTVTVTVASASAKEITAFSFPAVKWTETANNTYGTTISGNSITVKLPYGSTSMVATFATTGASVTVGGAVQESGVTSNDFTNPVTYRVTAADGSTQDYTVTVFFAPAVGCNFITGKSSSWYSTASTTTDASSVSLGLTCDAINAGSGDTFTMRIQANWQGTYYPYIPGTTLEGPFLTVPSDTTVSYDGINCSMLNIVGPLNSIQSVITQLQYIPPAYAGEDENYFILTDKNGLKAWGRLIFSVSEPVE